MIDEAEENEIDLIVTAAPSMCEVRLAAGNDPQTSDGHILRYTISTPGSLVVRLRQGASTTIASWTHSSIAVPTLFEQTLTTEQANSITDYSDLRLQFEAI